MAVRDDDQIDVCRISTNARELRPKPTALTAERVLGGAQPGVDKNECVLAAHEQAVVGAVRRLGFGTHRGREFVGLDIVEDELDNRRTSTVTEQPALGPRRQHVDLLHTGSVGLRSRMRSSSTISRTRCSVRRRTDHWGRFRVPKEPPPTDWTG
jgi:hypothetical protein